MSTATFDYAKTAYVAEDNSLVFIGTGVSDGAQNNRYIELNPSAENGGHENKSFILKMGDWFASVGLKIKDYVLGLVDKINKKK